MTGQFYGAVLAFVAMGTAMQAAEPPCGDSERADWIMDYAEAALCAAVQGSPDGASFDDVVADAEQRLNASCKRREVYFSMVGVTYGALNRQRLETIGRVERGGALLYAGPNFGEYGTCP
ncbi:MAG: hypothetical protein AAGL49_08890 [Pseudomonadota bacterium]